MTAAARRERVLIVDDDEAQRQIARAVLEAEGFEVLEALDGLEALQIVATTLPDILVLDVEMPRLNGFECCRRLREDPLTRALPIMMATGLDDTESVTRAYAAGATDFTTKPTNWTALPHRLRFLLRAARNLQRVQQYADHNDALLKALPDRVMRLNDSGELLEGGWTEISTAPHTPAALRRTLASIVGEKAAPQAMRKLKAAAQSGKLVSLEYEVTENARPRTKELRAIRSAPTELLAVERDITEAREAQSRLRALAYVDSLTGLPNRQWLIDDMDQRIAATADPFLLLLLDLDHFRLINDLLGYQGGNEVLKTMATRIAARLTEDAGRGMKAADEAILVRLGGDRFGVLCSNNCDTKAMDELVANVAAAIAQPVYAANQELVVTMSSGSCRYPADGQSGGNLLQHAELAARDAKQAGRNTHCEFSAELRRRSTDQIDLVSRLRKALESNQLQLHFQPKIDLREGRLKGFEALLRWRCDREGWIAPARFIPLAEESGLIIPLTEWVLRHALQTALDWRQQVGQVVPVAVNISARQFALRDPAQLIARALADTCAGPECLEIEITESAVMCDVSKAVTVLASLRGLGVRSSIDDFGTGHSSLAYLRDLPVDSIKIDRAFVSSLGVVSSPANQICRTVVLLGHALGFEVVAEGVETAEQLELLRAMDCDQAQGYLIARPMDAAHALAMLQGPSDAARLRSAI